jgi:hypothetical protein
MYDAINQMKADVVNLANNLDGKGYSTTSKKILDLSGMLQEMKGWIARAQSASQKSTPFSYTKAYDFQYDIRGLYDDLNKIDSVLKVLKNISTNPVSSTNISKAMSLADQIHDEIMAAEDVYDQEKSSSKRMPKYRPAQYRGTRKSYYKNNNKFGIGDEVVATEWEDEPIEGKIIDMRPIDLNDPDSEMTYKVEFQGISGGSQEWIPESELERSTKATEGKFRYASRSRF